jgi:hypothetical protein
MSYPFVPAYWDNYGPRKGPLLGIGLHMAEGGGTVGYLDKIGTIPPRGVSVHAVCDRAGVVTQMLKWTDASGSLNPGDRSTEKGYYGHSVLVAVLGDWWTDPNSAIVSMEIEGMAATGPNALQVPAVIAWGLDMRRMFATIRGAFGHADQTDTKGCPGTTAAMKAIFAGIGGHGLFVTPPQTSTVAPAGSTGGTDVSIATAGVKLTSDHIATFTAATPYLDAPAGKSIGAGSRVGYIVPYIGDSAGFAAVIVTTGLLYPDKLARPTIVYVPRSAVTITAAPVAPPDTTSAPDTTPFSQTDVAAAIAADRLKAHITWQ